jgi:hypothetical protein
MTSMSSPPVYTPLTTTEHLIRGARFYHDNYPTHRGDHLMLKREPYNDYVRVCLLETPLTCTGQECHHYLQRRKPCRLHQARAGRGAGPVHRRPPLPQPALLTVRTRRTSC